MGIYSRPEITEEKIGDIQKIIADNPGYGRSKISVALCEQWNWRTVDGRTKDMSCRDLLLSLEKAGKILLPERQMMPRPPGREKIEHLAHNETPIIGKLKELTPLRLEVVSGKASLGEFKSLLAQYHYLGFDRFIGERMAYMAYSRDRAPLACLLFGAAAWSCRDRDIYLGWNKEQRGRNLCLVADNSRFLIMPWVRVEHLASHILALAARRVSGDWEKVYGHRLAMLETFVETGRFRGTCYQAANWRRVGRTTGRGRNGGHKHAIMPAKDIYIYPLVKNYLRLLKEQDDQGISLSREEKH